MLTIGWGLFILFDSHFRVMSSLLFRVTHHPLVLLITNDERGLGMRLLGTTNKWCTNTIALHLDPRAQITVCIARCPKVTLNLPLLGRTLGTAKGRYADEKYGYLVSFTESSPSRRFLLFTFLWMSLFSIMGIMRLSGVGPWATACCSDRSWCVWILNSISSCPIWVRLGFCKLPRNYCL